MGKLEEQDFDEKRLARRQRRQRSQLIAYIILVSMIVVVLLAGGLGVHYIKKAFRNMKAEKVAEQEASLENSQQENVVIETPSDVAMEPEEMSESDVLDDAADNLIAALSLEDKVAGLFMVSPEQFTGVDTVVKAGSSTQEALSRYAVGGIVYSAKNVKSTEQISEMIQNTNSMSKYPIFTAIREDGSSDGTITASIGGIEQVEVNNADTAYTFATNIAATMFKYGFNFNIAPSVDISENGKYGTDASAVKEITASLAMGLQDSGITACVYDFPVGASDLSKLATDDTSTEIFESGIYDIYRSVFDSGRAGAVMMSDISLPNVTGDNTPASLSSKMISDELRGKLGFNGVVLTGPLNQGAITEYYTSAEAAVNAINAGADIIYLPENFEEAYNGVLEAVQNGVISEERINESLRRIYRIKYADSIGESN
ncbi:glycoside hydrolase family 3 N-terminal domain-containing protein [Butyrivibrio sp. YAB3001]|uniref:glycoside hydrolase family 3 N-terminal domain-containing protein n=1 Tax=Butyrivibrio sp. YAB3001 TaxID=1520812 RepID=UPI0008F63389|nr:glycoside hydrolase family 3 N-terminal domain-containing protein [Butyrivibrio sp. YAB3001]SFB71933.1 beta-N-acetylhexosaminidase [Butyrivibrio sp. YAB3001]